MRIFWLIIILIITAINANSQELFKIFINDKEVNDLYCIGDSVKFSIEYEIEDIQIDSIKWSFTLCTSPHCATQIDSFEIIKTYKSDYQYVIFNYDTPAFSGNVIEATIYYKNKQINKLYEISKLYTTSYCDITKPGFISDKKSICIGDCINFADISNRYPTWRSWEFEGADTKFSSDSSPVNICYSEAGQYKVTMFVGNPVDTDTVEVEHYIDVKPKGNIILPEYQTLTAMVGDTLLLEGCSQGDKYSWSPDIGLSCDTCQNSELIVSGNVKYTNTIESKNYCPFECKVDVKVSNDDFIFIPNIFTPNGDGINDIVLPSYNKDIQITKFSIFNRWGGILFSTNNPTEGWDGKYNNEDLNPGVYVYLLEYNNIRNNTKRVKSGAITLMK